MNRILVETVQVRAEHLRIGDVMRHPGVDSRWRRVTAVLGPGSVPPSPALDETVRDLDSRYRIVQVESEAPAWFDSFLPLASPESVVHYYRLAAVETVEIQVLRAWYHRRPTEDLNLPDCEDRCEDPDCEECSRALAPWR